VVIGGAHLRSYQGLNHSLEVYQLLKILQLSAANVNCLSKR